MTVLFQDEQLDEFGTWPLANIPYGGGEFGELTAVAQAVGDGGADEFYDAWTAKAARVAADADAAADAGHLDSARARHLRASAYYATAYHPLYGAPTDPRIVDAFDKQIAQFDAGLALGPQPSGPARIPYDDTTLPAYLIPADGHAGECRPLIIFTNGYDATVTDMYFASAVAALRRGYHCLLFDGPGQGEMLYRQGVPMRPDSEHVIGQVVDWALEQPIVDPDRVVLSGWSLGGHLAPRGASGEHRLAAVIADPGQWDVGATAKAFAVGMGAAPEAVDHPADIDQAVIDSMTSIIESIPRMRWAILQRGFWVNGVTDLRGFLAATISYSLAGVGTDISCPILVTAAEHDALAQGVETFVEKLGDRATLMRFTAAEGAGDHCEMGNRTLLNQRVLGWLDDTLADFTG